MYSPQLISPFGPSTLATEEAYLVHGPHNTFSQFYSRAYYWPRPVHVEPKPGRNDPCPCNSGLKYKHCCLPNER